MTSSAQALDGSLERLGLDYVDLLLIHWPNPGQDRYVEAWEGLVSLLEAGRVRAIGTSNFKPAHLERIIAATRVAAMIRSRWVGWFEVPPGDPAAPEQRTQVLPTST